MNEVLEPRCGSPMWGLRPMDVDCIRCWPQKGYGWRPTRKGKARCEDEDVSPRMSDVKGVCLYCAGTGITPIPLREVIRNPPWGQAEVDEWEKVR
jgi:5-methylcytosine-specific restriction endonuclease McrA